MGGKSTIFGEALKDIPDYDPNDSNSNKTYGFTLKTFDVLSETFDEEQYVKYNILFMCAKTSFSIDTVDGEKVFFKVYINFAPVLYIDSNKEINMSYIICPTVYAFTSDSANSTVKCSESDSELLSCDGCKNYVNDLYDAIKVLPSEKVGETYYPYIASVKDHWFRNVYFEAEEIPSSETIIQTDEEYEQKTGERWTKYEMHQDSNYQDDGYELYTYFTNGYTLMEDGVRINDFESYMTKFMQTSNNNYVVCVKDSSGTKYSQIEGTNEYEKDSNGEYTLKVLNIDSSGHRTYTNYTERSPEKFKTGKKAIIDNSIESGWTAYEEREDNKSSLLEDWKKIEIDDISVTDEMASRLDMMKGLSDVGVEFQSRMDYTSKKLKVQTRDGLRGETNAKIKKIFLDEYYLYDGSTTTARLVATAKDAVRKKFNDASAYAMLGVDPDTVKNYLFVFSMFRNNDMDFLFDDPNVYRKFFPDKNITTYLEDSNGNTLPGQTSVSIDDISGSINLTHNSLNAFSILKNMHTLDAEYIYHDFKELIVELNYFDKEDLVEAEEEVMMFPIQGITSAGWPEYRYDKSEEFYGTLIHSAEDYEAKRAEYAAEMADLFSNEVEVPDDAISTDTSEETTPETSRDTAESRTTVNNSENLLYQAAKDISEYMQADGGYEYSQPNRAPSFEISKQEGRKYLDCSAYVSWCLQEVGIFDPGETTDSSSIKTLSKLSDYYTAGSLSSYSDCKIGTILIFDKHVNIYAGNNKFYDGGSTRSINTSPINEYPPGPGYSGIRPQDVKGYIYIPNDKMTYNGVTGVETDSSVASSAVYAGYSGGEPVLSPVTGEVVKYGTVDRQNIETGENETVGFIKIRSLGSKEAEVGSKECTAFLGRTHERVTEGDANTPANEWLQSKYSTEQLEKLGYDYFWQEYADATINDCVMYIEGFDVKAILGDSINNSIESKSKDNVETLQNYIANHESECKYSTHYTVPNLLDETKEYELKVREEAKKEAVFTVTNDGRIYIKEGAVIGYTYNKEDLKTEEVQIPTKDETGNDITETYYKGNYMRLIFRDRNGEVIENVENYIEVDKVEGSGGKESVTSETQEYTAQSGDLELLADVIHHEHCGGGYGDTEEEHVYISKSMGYTVLNKLIPDGKYWVDYSDSKNIWAPDKSLLYNLVCRQDSLKFYAIATEANCGDTLNLKERCDQGKLNSCQYCMEAAEYCLTYDSTSLLNIGKFDTGYTENAPMPHTCWEQGQSHSGGKIWSKNGADYLFDTFDR